MRDVRTKLGACALLGAVGCQPAVESGTRTSGARLVIDEAREHLVVPDSDRDSVHIMSLDGRRAQEVAVGREPSRALVAGERVYVSLRAERAVAVLARAGERWELVQRLPVGPEPMGLAFDGATERLYVASSMSDRVQELSVPDGRVLRELEVPGQPRALALGPTGQTLYVTTDLRGAFVVDLPTGEVRPLPLPVIVTEAGVPRTLRLTGDLVVDPTGRRVTLPAMYIDTTSPIDDTVPPPSAPATNAYAASVVSTTDSGRFTPAVVDVPIVDDGGPPASPTVTALSGGSSDAAPPTAVAYDPSGESLWIVREGRAAPSVLAGDPDRRASIDGVLENQLPERGGYADGVVAVDAARAFTVSTLLRTSEELTLSNELEPRGRVDLPTSPLSPEAQRGRVLFFRGDNGAMSSGGMACGTCHVEGRTDGLTWPFVRGPRQTPSLAERVSERTPLRTAGDRMSVAEDAELTARVMGGQGLTPQDARDIQAYVDSIRGVDLSREPAPSGRAAFERADCASCHEGELHTDRQKHALRDREPVQTPSLIGVAATPPYLFDGVAPDLADVLARAPSQGHGAVERLSTDERAALLRYLQAL
jgi:hypothetical protein